MAQLLGNVAVGSIVKLKEKGISQNYIVVHQGLPSSLYDSSCNGTWLLRQNIIKNQKWDTSGNEYASALIQNELYAISSNVIDPDIGAKIKTVKIPYCIGGGSSQVNSGANGLSCKTFLLSGVEVGLGKIVDRFFPVDGAKLSYFKSGTETSANNQRIAKLDGSSTKWWLRSPPVDKDDSVWSVEPDGNCNYWFVYNSYGVRPAMVMPTNLLVDDSNNIVLFPTIAKLTAPSIAMQGQQIPLSWTPIPISVSNVTYQLQRNVNNGGWQNVGSPISQTSYTDTAQSGWTQVQYQVAAVIIGITGDYTQSSIIPVLDPSVLVISGSDGNLGTLTSNVPYTVLSNTGNPISLTRTVNGAQVVTLEVESGFVYSIPVADLPTGAGTIQITASVKTSSGNVTQTRTWTYYKTPINIPQTGGIAQLVENGQNIWPISVAECIKVPTYFGNTLDKALELIAPAINPTVIAAGTYVGTGQYGPSTPNILNFSTQPLIVLVYGPNISLSITSTNSSSKAYISGTQAKWYSDVNAEEQLNSSGVEYSYIAIVKT